MHALLKLIKTHDLTVTIEFDKPHDCFRVLLKHPDDEPLLKLVTEDEIEDLGNILMSAWETN